MIKTLDMPKKKLAIERPPAVTAKEAAEMLGVSRMTISRYIDQGLLKGYSRKGILGRGNQVYVYVDSIKEFVASQEINPK